MYECFDFVLFGTYCCWHLACTRHSSLARQLPSSTNATELLVQCSLLKQQALHAINECAGAAC
jgi:hypothetical protein